MRPVDDFISVEYHYALGTDIESGKHYAAIPVTIGVVDYEEYYELDDDQLAYYLLYPADALAFIEECRARKHDNLLMQKPGWNRGIPY
jgi:hypothetical protein